MTPDGLVTPVGLATPDGSATPGAPAPAPAPLGVDRRLSDLVSRLGAVDLAEIQEVADLQTRVDRKYVVPTSVLVDFLADQRGLLVLEVAGRRRSGYRSVYFDTPGLQSYRSAAHGHRRRFKVRTRTYADSGECVFEVKVKGGRGETVKERLAYDLTSAGSVDPQARAFAATVLQPSLPDARRVVAALGPTLVTTYDRTTFVDPLAGTRLTCDAALVCTPPPGEGDEPTQAGYRTTGSVGLGDQVVLESKSPGTATVVDRWLWAHGHRPVSLSKYCVGLAALDAALPANRWTRTLRRHVVCGTDGPGEHGA